MHAISRVHEAGFKPINGCSLEVREDEQDLLLIRGKDMGPIMEVQIARDKEVLQFSWVCTVKGVGFVHLYLFRPSSGLWLAHSTDASGKVGHDL